jgi:DNA-binding MarR family transcriptional regulator
MTSDLTSALRGSLGALSSQLRLLFADPDASGQGFVALATLRHLCWHGPRTVTSLAASERVTTQAVSLRIKPLEEAGLVVRHRDGDDRRRTVVTPTAAGIAVLDAAEQRADTALRTAVSRLSERDRGVLRQVVPILESLAADLSGAAS